MRSEWLPLLTLLAAPVALGAEPAVDASDASEADPANEVVVDPAAVAHFEQVARVLQSPRCQNCHPAGDVPLQGDEGLPHAFRIDRFSAAVGLPCTSCHRPVGRDGAHLPPTSAVWHMPPPNQVFEGRTLPELCAQLKDPERTGGRDLQALIEHVSDDPLVLWGWAPGGGRTLPDVAHADFVKAFEDWVAGGAPCPVEP